MPRRKYPIMELVNKLKKKEDEEFYENLPKKRRLRLKRSTSSEEAEDTSNSKNTSNSKSSEGENSDDRNFIESEADEETCESINDETEAEDVDIIKRSNLRKILIKKLEKSGEITDENRDKMEELIRDRMDQVEEGLLAILDKENIIEDEDDEHGDILKGVPEEKRKEVKEKYETIKKQMEKDTPTIDTILEAKISEDIRKKCIELFHLMIDQDPVSQEYIDARDKLVVMLKTPYEEEADTMIKEYEEKFKNENLKVDFFSLKRQIFELKTTDDNKSIIYSRYQKLEKMEPNDEEYKEIINWLDWVIGLPFDKVAFSPLKELGSPELNKYIKQVWSKLNEKLYGMKETKQEFMQVLINKITQKSSKGLTLALKGPPGVGKTTLATAFAYAIGAPFEKISVNGMTDSAIFKGSNSLYIGSSPSIVLQIMKRAKCSDPVILIDEVDKIAQSEKAREVQDSLLNILDDHNNQFQDCYISQFSHDISRITLFLSFNDENDINAILRDRLYIITVKPYNNDEKKIITTQYILPSELEKAGMDKSDMTFSEDGYKRMIKILKGDESNSGVRYIKNAVRNIVLKIKLLKHILLDDGTTGEIELTYKIKGLKFPFVITPEVIDELMKDQKDEEKQKNESFLRFYH